MANSNDELQVLTASGKIKRNFPFLIITASEDELKKRTEQRSLQQYSKKLKCTKCSRDFSNLIKNGEELCLHPVLKVLFCESCCRFYGNGEFSVDEDEDDKYCRWCGEGGSLFLCSNCICGFCSKCINRNLGVQVLKEIKNKDHWSCFLCQPEPLYELRNIGYLAVQESRANKKKSKESREKRLFRLKNKVSGSQQGNSSRKRRRITKSSSPSPGPSNKNDDDKKRKVENSTAEKEENSKKITKGIIKKEMKESPKVTSPSKIKANLENMHESLKPALKTLQRLNSVAQIFSKSCERIINEVLSMNDAKKVAKVNTKLTKMSSLFVEMVIGVCEKNTDSCTNKGNINNDKDDVIIDYENTNCDISIVNELVNLEATPDISILQETGSKAKDNISENEKTVGGDEVADNVKDKTDGNSAKSLDKNKTSDSTNSSTIENSDEKEVIRCSKISKMNGSTSDEERIIETFESDNDDAKKTNSAAQDNGAMIIETVDSNSNDSSKKGNNVDEKNKERNVKNLVVTEKSKALKGGENQKTGKDSDDATANKDEDDDDKNNQSDENVKTDTIKDTANNTSNVDPPRNIISDSDLEDNYVQETDSDKEENVTKNVDGDKTADDEKDDKNIVKESLTNDNCTNNLTVENNSKVMDDDDQVFNISTDDDVSNCDNESKVKNEANLTKSKVLATSSDSSDGKNKRDLSSDLSDNGNKRRTPLKKKKSKNMRNARSSLNKIDDSSTEDDDDKFKLKRDRSSENSKKTSEEIKECNASDNDNNHDNSIKSLTNLKSLERSKKSSSKEVKKVGNKTAKKVKEKDDTLLDMLNEMGVNSNTENDSDASQGGWLKSFCHTNMSILKELVLGSSSSNEITSSDDNCEVDDEKSTASKKRNRSSDEEFLKKKKTKKRVLLNSDDSDCSVKLPDTDDDDDNDNDTDDNKNKKRKRIKSNDSSDDSTTNKTTKKKKSSSSSDESSDKRKKWNRIARDSSDSSSSNENCASQKTDTPSKGRKNIRNVLKKDSLKMETKAAVKAEEARKERLRERQKKFDSFFSNESKRLILDFDDDGEVLVEVSLKLVKKLKPHQFEGVKFMWDNLFESTSCVESSNGSGCILAHCMGLGKTLQVITLLHTVFTQNVGVETALIVCPLNTVANWVNELEMWLGVARCDSIDIYEMSKYKKLIDRRYQLKTWHQKGGIMIMSYDMFRNCTKSPKGVFQTTLLTPGPDMVVCDEGHLLKNEDSVLSKCMSQTLTSRRIVLTGTPLQNNLKEYHCMVQFIKPNLLGTKKEFSNRFVNPIENGQFEDSTDYDVRLMKRRSHVLHTMLEGCIQRRDYTVLTPFLPPKQEYVLSVKLSEPLATLYKYYIANVSIRATGSKVATSIFHDYHALHRIWTHPLVMQAQFEQTLDKKAKAAEMAESDEFIDDDDDDDNKTSDEKDSSSDSSVQCVSDDSTKQGNQGRSTRRNPIVEEVKETTPAEPEKSWWDGLIDDKLFEEESVSNKLTILFSILDECTELGDKCLVFSQSLFTLDLIEHFLEKRHRNGEDWKLGKNYFRLDGSSSSDSRASWCKAFNREENKNARLFLISTKAGGLGINLVGANRVVIFDASWNPSHDLQSIFRIFRFGQKKPCFVYRLLAEATMEEKIYARQVTKLSMAGRVVDEHQIERHYTMGKLQELYNFEPLPREKWKIPLVPKDPLLAKILKTYENEIVGYHEHDSLLENKEEEELTETERKSAWEEYENSQNPVKLMTTDQGFQTALAQSFNQRLAMNQLMSQNLQMNPNLLMNPNRQINPNLLMNMNRQINPNMQMLPNPAAQMILTPEFIQSLELLPTQKLIQCGKYYNILPMPDENPTAFRQRLMTHLRILSYGQEILIN